MLTGNPCRQNEKGIFFFVCFRRRIIFEGIFVATLAPLLIDKSINSPGVCVLRHYRYRVDRSIAQVAIPLCSPDHRHAWMQANLHCIKLQNRSERKEQAIVEKADCKLFPKRQQLEKSTATALEQVEADEVTISTMSFRSFYISSDRFFVFKFG